MATQSEKEQVIRHIYYDADDGFDNINTTYQKSKKALSSITIDDVKQFLAKHKLRQTKDYRGFNSYVTDAPLQELQIDLADFTRSAEENNGFRYLMVGIDVFSKLVHAVPIRTKQTSDIVHGFTEILNKIGVPSQIFVDNEGGMSSTEFIRLLNKHNIKQFITTSPPPFVERVIQTLKNMLMTRVQASDMNIEKWTGFLPAVLKKYNNTPHSSTKLSPNEGHKQENRFKVFVNIRKKAQWNRSYPKLEVGNLVRTRVKKHTFKKGYQSSWSDNVFNITFIKDGQYLIGNDNRHRVWNMHDSLLVPAVEGKDGQVNSD